WTVERAGKSFVKYFAYTSFIAAKLFMSLRKTVANFVHRGEVVHVTEEDGGFDDVGKIQALRAEKAFDVFQHARGLFGDAACDNVAGRWIEWNLAGAEKEISGPNSL